MQQSENISSPEANVDCEMIIKSIEHLSEALNGKAEYYIGGGLATYILSGTELDREFSDIDIMVPESEIENTKSALEAANYRFWDEKLIHKSRQDLVGLNGHHEYGAMDNITSTRIGIYTFDYLSDGRIVFRQHYGEPDSDGVLIDKISETILPIEISKDDLFSPEPTQFNDCLVFTATPEQIYIRKKNGSREKDISDFQKIKPMIDPSKLSRLDIAIQDIETKIY